MFKVVYVLWGSNVSQRKPEIDCSRVSCSDVCECYSMCYFFSDRSATMILNLTEKWLEIPDEVSINTSCVNNSSVILKLFRKRLVFSSNSCIQLLLD